MEALSRKRLQGKDFYTIIPLIYRKTQPMPAVSAKVQYIDISSALLIGRGYYTRTEFRTKIRQVVEHIGRVAEALSQGQALPRCKGFQIPAQSAFAAYEPEPRPGPFRSHTP